MKITMLDTVEDSNPHIKDEGGKDVVRYETDVFVKGKEYDLPKRQAERLVDLGFAE